MNPIFILQLYFIIMPNTASSAHFKMVNVFFKIQVDIYRA